MTLQNDLHTARHRRKLARRAEEPIATEPKTPVRPKPTVVAPTATPVRPPVKPTVTRVLPPPTKPIVTPPLTTARTPPVIPPVISPAIPSIPVTTAAPVIPPPVVATSSPQVPTTSSLVIPTTSSTPTKPAHARPTSSASATPTVSPQPSGGVSTGAVVGGIIGGFAALGLIAAALFLFLRRTREKRQTNAEVFDATEFRRSAVILEDPAEKRRRPRPPTMIEQHVQNTPAARSNRNTPPNGGHGEQAQHGAPYPGQGLYNAPYPGAHNHHQAQAPYDQYPPPPSTYGYGHPHAYPPQPHYPPQPPYGSQHHGTYPHTTPPSLHIPDNSSSRQDDMSLPNPFASSPVSEMDGPTQRSLVTTPNHVQTESGSAASHSTGNDDAPPAYEASGKFAGYKPDVKVKPVLLTVNPTSSPSSASASASSAPITSAASSMGLTVTSTPLARPVGDKNLPERPLSSTSVLTTVYDMRDAYGGI